MRATAFGERPTCVQTGLSGGLPIGGNVPQSLVNQACLDIQQGRAGVVLLAGAETWRTRRGLRAKGGKLTWTVQGDSVPMAEVSGGRLAAAVTAAGTPGGSAPASPGPGPASRRPISAG